MCLIAKAFGSSNDIIRLTNNLEFIGDVKKISNCYVKFKTNGEKYWIPVDDIHFIKFENPNDKVLLDYNKLSGSDKCMKGQMDAEMYHGKKGGHIALGFLFGPFAMIGAAIAEPTPQRGQSTMMMSENKELFNDPSYLTCYKKKARAKNVGNAGIGWASWVLILLLAAGA
jgi:hypothetical protein